MKVGIIVSVAFWALVAVYSTGCAGVEAFSSVGIRRVDEHHSRQYTRASQTKPLKCWFISCDEPRGGEAYGS